jgi:hypothetical protein
LRSEAVDLAMEALFGRGFSIQIVPDDAENKRILGAPRIDEETSSTARKIRHWRQGLAR